jgi:hypothetical protein
MISWKIHPTLKGVGFLFLLVAKIRFQRKELSVIEKK